MSHFIAYHPKIILIVASLLLIPAIICFFLTGVNYEVLSYLPSDLDSVKGIEILDDTYNMASSTIVILENMSGKQVQRTKEKIEQLDGVRKVMWVDMIADVTIPQSVLPDFMTDVFYSEDGNATMLIVEHTAPSADTRTLDCIDEIEDILDEGCFLSGLSALTADTRALCNSEAIIYITVAIVLALIALSLTLDSWLLPLILLVSLGYAVIYNMGTNLMFGDISFLTQTVAAVLQLGVTMDYSVFLVDRFDEERLRHDDLRDAMAAAVSGTFTSLLSSSLTTVFGFVALCFMSFTLGLDIGIVMAKGVVFGVLTVVIVLPAFILLFSKQIHKYGHKRLIPDFSKINAFTIKHRKAFVILFCAIIIPAWFFKSNVTMFYDMAKTMPQDMNSIVGLEKLSDEFDMAQMQLVLVHEDIGEKNISSMIKDIEKVDGVSDVVAAESFIGAAIPMDILPEDVLEICRQGGWNLVMIKSDCETGTGEAGEQIEKIKEIIGRYDSGSYLTGEGVLTEDLIHVTDRDFKVTGIISIVSIFILIAICFKSVSIPVILVASIELAIFINESVPFFMGTEVPFISPTIIGCVQLGATVDYAILLTSRFREELRKGSDKKQAILTASNESHKSIFQSALVFFSATAGVYFACNIVIVRSICAMLARGAVISGLVIIFILPPILYVLEGVIDKTTVSWKKLKGEKIK